MIARSTALPLEQVEIENHGYEATVSLWNGEYATETDADGNIEYIYDIYQTRHRWRIGLQDAVYALFDKWYAAAEKAEEREIARAEIDDCKSRLSETDYRVIKCAEVFLNDLSAAQKAKLPYDIDELHAEKQAQRDKITAMERAL